MTDAARLLAAWLSPALWLALPALIVARGPEGLWLALVATVAPLVALVVRAQAEPAAGSSAMRVRAGVRLVVAAIAVASGTMLAGDLAVWRGAPRWQGVAAAVVVAALAAAWRSGGPWVGMLWLVGLVGVSAPLAELAREAGVHPIAAWHEVATQRAFVFPKTSPWVNGGHPLGAGGARVPIAFVEEHRVTAPEGGALRGRSADGGRVIELEWTLEAGQSITLRGGDWLAEGTAVRLQFEANKRVPGAPMSGIEWAAWPRGDGWAQLGLGATLVLGAIGLLRPGGPAPSRRTALAVGVGLLLVLAWAQGWATYGLYAAPDVFVGGVRIERLADLAALAPGGRAALELAVVAAGVAGFAASGLALRERLVPSVGSVQHDRLAWLGAIALGGAASLWHLDPWRLIVLALGVAAAGLAPATVWRPAGSAAGTASAVLGLVVFIALTVLAETRGIAPSIVASPRLAWAEALREAVLAYPAIAAAPAGAAVLLLARRRTRQRVPAAVRSVR